MKDVDTRNQVANILTKSLGKILFQKIKSMMGVHDLHMI
jgi:hypothetical protein